MRIGIDASRANKDQKTGVEWYSHHIIEELKKMTRSAGSGQASDVIPSEVEESSGISPRTSLSRDDTFVLYTNKKLKGELGECPDSFKEKFLGWWPKYLWTQVRLWLELVISPPDVLFVPAHTIPFLPISKKIKVVVNVHDVGFKRFPKLYKKIQVWYHDLTMKKIRKRADVIITISEFSKKEIMNLYGVDEQKIKVVYLAGDRIDRSQVGGFRFREKQPYLLFVGRIEKKKNVENIVRAFVGVKNKYPKLNLILAGSEGNATLDVKDLIRAEGIDDRVILPGYVPEEEMLGLMAGAGVFLFPTFYEGFGLPILQAMGAGAPVIASDQNPHKEVGGGAAIYVDPADPAEMAKKIEMIFENPELRQRLIQGGYRRIKDFSWEKTAEGVLDILAS